MTAGDRGCGRTTVVVAALNVRSTCRKPLMMHGAFVSRASSSLRRSAAHSRRSCFRARRRQIGVGHATLPAAAAAAVGASTLGGPLSVSRRRRRRTCLRVCGRTDGDKRRVGRAPNGAPLDNGDTGRRQSPTGVFCRR